MPWKGVPVRPTTHRVQVRDPAGGEVRPASPRLIGSLPHPDRKAFVFQVAFTPTGALFAAGYPSGVVQLWDVATRREVRRIETPPGFRSQSEYALAPSDYSCLYVTSDGKSRPPVEAKGKDTVRWDYQGEALAWDLASGRRKPGIKAPAGFGFGAGTLSPDGKRLFVWETGSHRSDEPEPPRVRRLYDTATGKGVRLGVGFGQAAFTPDSRALVVSIGGREPGVRELKLLDLDGKELATLDRDARHIFYWPTVSPDGKRVAAEARGADRNTGSAVRLYDLATRERLAEFAGDHPFLQPTFSPDGRLLVVCDQNDNLFVWDVVQRKLIRRHTFPQTWLGKAVAFSPDGRKLAVPARAKTADDRRILELDWLDMPQPRVYLFDLTTKAEPEEVVCPHGANGGVAFSPDGKTLAAGGGGAVHLFDVGRPQP